MREAWADELLVTDGLTESMPDAPPRTGATDAGLDPDRTDKPGICPKGDPAPAPGPTSNPADPGDGGGLILPWGDPGAGCASGFLARSGARKPRNAMSVKSSA